SFADPLANGATGAVAVKRRASSPVPGVLVLGTPVLATAAGPPMDTSPDPIVIGFGGVDRIFSGFAWHFWRQAAEQRKFSLPWSGVLERAAAGFPSIPQTGSFACALPDDGAAFRMSTGSRWSIVAVRSLYRNQSSPSHRQLPSCSPPSS